MGQAPAFARGWALADRVDGDQGGDVVGAQGEGTGQALVGVGAADNVQRMQDGPVEGLLVGGRGRAGEDIVVGLRPGQAQDAAEGSLQLVLQLKLLLGRGAGAASVDDDDGVQDVAGRVEGVHRLRHPVLAASRRQAGAGAKQKIGQGAIGVVEHGDGDGRGVRGHGVGGKDEAGGVEVGVLPADVLGQRAALGDGDAGDGQVPDACGRGDEGVGGLVVDRGAERAGVGEVEQLRLLPADGLAGGRGEEGWTGDEAGTAGMGHGGEQEQRRDEGVSAHRAGL